MLGRVMGLSQEPANVALGAPGIGAARIVGTIPALQSRLCGAINGARPGECLLAGSRWGEHGLVFTSSIGTPMDERVRRAFKGLVQAGLPPRRIHDLR
jgi:hypothetical protein